MISQNETPRWAWYPIPGIHFHKRRRHTHLPGYVQQAPESLVRGNRSAENLSPAHAPAFLRLDASARRRGQKYGRRPRRSWRYVVFGAHLLSPADAAQAGRRQAYGRMPDSDTKRSAVGFVKKTSIEAGNCVCYHEFNKSEFLEESF